MKSLVYAVSDQALRLLTLLKEEADLKHAKHLKISQIIIRFARIPFNLWNNLFYFKSWSRTLYFIMFLL